jgi:hypothetical protein
VGFDGEVMVLRRRGSAEVVVMRGSARVVSSVATGNVTIR